MIKLLLLLFKGATIGKFLLSGGSMLLTMCLYAWGFGWPFAVGLVLLIFIHEMGHYFAAKHKGLEVGWPMIIPFVGWTSIKEPPKNAEDAAYVGMGGPVLGTLGAMAFFYASRHLGSPLLLALSSFGFLINLINLIPLKPFDGGIITAVVSRKMWLIGAPILTVWFLYRPSIFLFIVAMAAAPHVIHAMRGDETDEERAYHIASMETRLGYGISYFALVIFLAMMWYSIQLELPQHI